MAAAPNSINHGTSIASEIDTVIQSPAFNVGSAEGLVTAAAGLRAGIQAATEADLSMPLADVSAMASTLNEVERERTFEAGSREADIEQLFAALSAFTVREARRQAQ